MTNKNELNAIGFGSKKSVSADYEMHFTRNKELIENYKNLRRELYKIDPRFIGYRRSSGNTLENCDDPDNHMLIVHKGSDVLGGGSLRISTPKKPIKLYIEQELSATPSREDFSLRTMFPQLGLNKYSCAEFDEITVHPSLRQGQCVKAICRAILDRCIDYNVRYMFGSGDKVRLRLYASIYKSLNFKTRIFDEVDIPLKPEHESVKRYVIFGDMMDLHFASGKKDAVQNLDPIESYTFY